MPDAVVNENEVRNVPCVPIVIEWYERDGREWGVSFDGHNPDEKDWVPMNDAATAFKLVGLIRKSLRGNPATHIGEERSRECATVDGVAKR